MRRNGMIWSTAAVTALPAVGTAACSIGGGGGGTDFSQQELASLPMPARESPAATRARASTSRTARAATELAGTGGNGGPDLTATPDAKDVDKVIAQVETINGG